MDKEIKYIAHPGQSLEDHLFGVAAKAQRFAAKIGLAEQGELIGLLHDLGKYSGKFQAYIKSATEMINPDEDEYVDAGLLKGKIDHSTAGAQYIWQALAGKGPLERCVAQVLGICVASHHSGLIDCLDADGQDIFGRRMSKSCEQTHVEEVRQVMDPRIRARSEELLKSTGLTGDLRELITRILSTNRSLPVVQQLQVGLMVRFLFSCLIDADRIDTADSECRRTRQFRPDGDYVLWSQLIDRLESYLLSIRMDSPIDSLRCEISRHCLEAAARPRGTYTLTVPTGGGKTLASLRFALHHAKQNKCDRVVYVVPYTSIIDQNAMVVRSILEPDSAPGDSGNVVLEHHASISPERQTWREKILCENWDAPVVYTTLVQFLESLFGAGTRGARRMHQLANAVIVFDEVQTVPIKCTHLFNSAVNFLVDHCNSTVVLCTATQPLLHQVSAQKGAIRLSGNHKIMRNERRLFEELRRVEVRDQRKPNGWSYGHVAELALKEKHRAGSCLVIVNTKDAARKLFEACSPDTGNDERVHLSTDMCPAHRKRELTRIKERLLNELPVLCVSTQLIEAGVDVDFGSVIRCMAGLDSIAQAAGRCNRNGRRARLGMVHIVNLADEHLGQLTDIKIGQEISARILDDHRSDATRHRANLCGPEALADYYNYYFFRRQEEMSYAVSASQIGHDDTVLNLLSCNSTAVSAYQKAGCNDATGRLLFQSFMTAAEAFKAIDAPTQAVIVPYGAEGRELISKLHGAFDVHLEFALLRRAQQYSVSVFPHVLDKLRVAGAVREVQKEARILALDERYYSAQFGLSTEPVSLMEILHV